MVCELCGRVTLIWMEERATGMVACGRCLRDDDMDGPVWDVVLGGNDGEH